VSATPDHPAKPPESYARKGANGQWYVDVRWSSGKHERLGPFMTKAEAEARIADQLEAWHDGGRLFKSD